MSKITCLGCAADSCFLSDHSQHCIDTIKELNPDFAFKLQEIYDEAVLNKGKYFKQTAFSKELCSHCKQLEESKK